MLANLLPTFVDETHLNVGRGEDGHLVTGRGARVPIRTSYAQGAAAWRHEVAADDFGCLRWCQDGAPVDTRGRYAGILSWDVGRPVDRLLYALDADGQLYVGDPTAESPDAIAWLRRAAGGPLPSAVHLWHHSSFVRGRPVICAGDLGTDGDGRLRVISNWSGHYHPNRGHLAMCIDVLVASGVDVRGAVAEVVRSAREVRAYALADQRLTLVSPEVTDRWFRALAIDVASRLFGVPFTEDDERELDRRVQRGRAEGPASFDPARRAHWAWMARYVLEDRLGLIPDADQGGPKSPASGSNGNQATNASSPHSERTSSAVSGSASDV